MLLNIVYIVYIVNNKCNVMVFFELIIFLEKNYFFRKKNCKIIYWMNVWIFICLIKKFFVIIKYFNRLWKII